MEAVMEKFVGKKFYCDHEYLERDDSVWWEEKYNTKKAFQMTTSYRNYLKEKRKKEKDEALRILKAKLDYQYKTYGEVDPIDYAEFIYKLNG